MLEFLLGKDIASYVRVHRGLVVCALVLTGISAFFVVVPAYLLQPSVDEGMKTGSDPATWRIPWIHLDLKKTSLIIPANSNENRLVGTSSKQLI